MKKEVFKVRTGEWQEIFDCPSFAEALRLVRHTKHCDENEGKHDKIYITHELEHYDESGEFIESEELAVHEYIW